MIFFNGKTFKLVSDKMISLRPIWMDRMKHRALVPLWQIQRLNLSWSIFKKDLHLFTIIYEYKYISIAQQIMKTKVSKEIWSSRLIVHMWKTVTHTIPITMVLDGIQIKSNVMRFTNTHCQETTYPSNAWSSHSLSTERACPSYSVTVENNII